MHVKRCGSVLFAQAMDERVRFLPRTEFQEAVSRVVAAYFQDRGLHPSGGRRLQVKAAVLAAWFVASYVGLMVWASTWWQSVPLAASLGLAVAGLGFNVQHDANHGSFSRRARTNRLLGFTLDLLGGSSY